MAKRRGNPNWGKPEPIGPIVPTITEFEQVVREYKLSPDQYLRSTRLREWARRNKNSNQRCNADVTGNFEGRRKATLFAFGNRQLELVLVVKKGFEKIRVRACL